MATKYSGVTRWRLRDDIAIVDACPEKDLSKAEGLPEDVHYPHLIDNIYEADESKRNLTLLTDIAGFIVRFIAMGVDTEKHLPDIVLSEYEDMTVELAKEEINKVVRLLEDLDYLLPRGKMPLPKPRRF